MLFSFCFVLSFFLIFFLFESSNSWNRPVGDEAFKFATGKIYVKTYVNYVKLIVCVKWKGPCFVFSYYHRSDERQVSL